MQYIGLISNLQSSLRYLKHTGRPGQNLSIPFFWSRQVGCTQGTSFSMLWKQHNVITTSHSLNTNCK